MLCIGRRVGERILIGDDIIITVLPFSRGSYGHVRLGIDAPKDVVIVREELTREEEGQE